MADMLTQLLAQKMQGNARKRTIDSGFLMQALMQPQQQARTSGQALAMGGSNAILALLLGKALKNEQAQQQAQQQGLQKALATALGSSSSGELGPMQEGMQGPGVPSQLGSAPDPRAALMQMMSLPNPQEALGTYGAIQKLLGGGEEAYNLSPGSKRMIGDKVIAENPAAPKEPKTQGIITLDVGGKQQSFRENDPQVDQLLSKGATLVRTPAAEVNIGTQQAPAGYMWTDPANPRGGLQKIPGGPAEQPTAEQSKSLEYLTRMQTADADINAAVESGYRPSVMDALAYLKTQDQDAPIASVLANFAMDGPTQKYFGAVSEYAAAKLRKESGASISVGEMIGELRRSFPLPGDGSEVIKQKRKRREVAMETFKKSAGPAYKEPEELFYDAQGNRIK